MCAIRLATNDLGTREAGSAATVCTRVIAAVVDPVPSFREPCWIFGGQVIASEEEQLTNGRRWHDFQAVFASAIAESGSAAIRCVVFGVPSIWNR